METSILVQKNPELMSVKSPPSHKPYQYVIKSKTITIREIRNIIKWTNAICQKKDLKSNSICFVLNNTEFFDKLSIMLLECLCEYLLGQNFNVHVKFINIHMNICTEEIIYSPLRLLAHYQSSNEDVIAQYKKCFRYHLYKSHFRKIISPDKNEDGMLASRVMQEVDIFLHSFNIVEDNRNAIAEVVSELLDNAIEHSQSECLFDIDITNNYVKKEDILQTSADSYYGVNIVILNFSETLMGDKLCETLADPDYCPTERTKIVLQARDNHKNYWDENYTEKDFYIISSFQHKVTSRKSKGRTGGTGLTKLLKLIEEKSENYNCYMISGNRTLNFIKEFLNHDENKWVGFNSQNDYINYIPNEDCLSISPVFFPGTAYNLNFVLKCEEDEF